MALRAMQQVINLIHHFSFASFTYSMFLMLYELIKSMNLYVAQFLGIRQ